MSNDQGERRAAKERRTHGKTEGSKTCMIDGGEGIAVRPDMKEDDKSFKPEIQKEKERQKEGGRMTWSCIESFCYLRQNTTI